MSAANEIIHNAIGGAPAPSASTRRQPVFNPATGEPVAELPLSTVDELDAAVQAAKAALPGWAAMPPLKRARFMFKFKELLDRHAADGVDDDVVVAAPAHDFTVDDIGDIDDGALGDRPVLLQGEELVADDADGLVGVVAELLVQRQLLGQGLAQVVVVVDDQDGLGRGHGSDNGEAWPPRQGLGA